jgi:hypothetical protein
VDSPVSRRQWQGGTPAVARLADAFVDRRQPLVHRAWPVERHRAIQIAARGRCTFFLDACIDQVRYMEGLLEPATLLARLERYASDAVSRGEIPGRSLALLREALLVGEVERGRIATILGVTDRQARNIVAVLVEKGLLVSAGPGTPVRLGFPSAVVGSWFPNLYPEFR